MSETKNEASSVEIAYQNWLAQVKVNIAKIDKFQIMNLERLMDEGNFPEGLKVEDRHVILAAVRARGEQIGFKRLW